VDSHGRLYPQRASAMQPGILTLWVILSTIAGEPVILPVRDPEAWPIDQNMRQFLEHPEH
jgi:hypothetical protein